MARPLNPADLAPQDESADSAAIRRGVALWLVIERADGSLGRYATNADHAWTHANNAYDHLSSEHEAPGDSGAYYIERKHAR